MSGLKPGMRLTRFSIANDQTSRRVTAPAGCRTSEPMATAMIARRA